MRNSSIITIRSMFALFVGMAFLFLGNGLIISSAGVELKKMGADELETGFDSYDIFAQDRLKSRPHQELWDICIAFWYRGDVSRP